MVVLSYSCCACSPTPQVFQAILRWSESCPSSLPKHHWLTALSKMSSVSHILNVLTVFSTKTSQPFTQEIFTLTALALTVPRIFLIFLGEKNLQFLYTIIYTETVFLLSNLYNNPTFSNRHISFHCFLYLSPHQHVHHSCKAWLQHNGKHISKNLQTYNQSMFCITQHLGSY